MHEGEGCCLNYLPTDALAFEVAMEPGNIEPRRQLAALKCMVR